VLQAGPAFCVGYFLFRRFQPPSQQLEPNSQQKRIRAANGRMTLPSFRSPSKRIGAIWRKCRNNFDEPASRRRIPSPAIGPLVQNAT
jgi:hypothetical protein